MTVAKGALVTATFTLEQFPLTVAAGNGHGSASSSPTGITCPGDCTESYDASSTVALTAIPDATSTFSGWIGGGCNTALTCQMTMSAATTVTATFALVHFTVNVSVNGNGSVTSDPEGISCPGDCIQTYNAGTTVRFTAMAADGSIFNGCYRNHWRRLRVIT